MKKWNEIVTEAKKINDKDYKFYVLNKAGTRIRSGWDNKEDAVEGRADDHPDKVGKIVAKVTLKQLNIDPDDNAVWSVAGE